MNMDYLSDKIRGSVRLNMAQRHGSKVQMNMWRMRTCGLDLDAIKQPRTCGK